MAGGRVRILNLKDFLYEPPQRSPCQRPLSSQQRCGPRFAKQRLGLVGGSVTTQAVGTGSFLGFADIYSGAGSRWGLR